MISSIICIIFWQAQHLSSLTFRHLSVDHPSLPWKRRHQITHNSLDGTCRSYWNYRKVWCRPVCNLQEMWNNIPYTWGPCGSPPSELPARLAGCFCSDQVWTPHGRWSFSKKNLIYLSCILRVNHSCLSCKGDGNYIPSSLLEQILKFLSFFKF